MKRRFAQAQKRSGERAIGGFTLIELLVAMAIFLIVTGAIYSLLEVGRSDNFTANQKTELLQNARIALNTMGSDTINAGSGYWRAGARVPDGTLERLLLLDAETDGEEDVLTPIVPGNNIRNVNVDGVNVATDEITFVYQDTTFNQGRGLAVNAGTVNATTNRITVSPDNTPANGGFLYVYIVDDGRSPALASLTTTVSTNRLEFGANDPLGLNFPGANSTFQAFVHDDAGNVIASPAATCRRVSWITYYVNPQGTLIRRDYGNTSQLVGSGVVSDGQGGVVPTAGDVGFVEMPLAYGVEDFQVRYVMNDGRVLDDVGPDAGDPGDPDDDLTASANRLNIRLVQFTLTIRSPEVDRRTREPLRMTLNGSFFAPNLGYEKR